MGITSHELKTPITSLKGYIQLNKRTLADGNLAQSSLYLDRTEAGIGKLQELVEELLDVSRIQGGHLELQMTEFDLDELITDVIHSIQHAVKHKIEKEGG